MASTPPQSEPFRAEGEIIADSTVIRTVPVQLAREEISLLESLVPATLVTLAATWSFQVESGLSTEVSAAEVNLLDAMIACRLDPMPTQQARVGPYWADFYFAEQRLAVEVDGKHHEQRRERDSVRDAYFTGQGVCVLRLSASAVWHDPVACVEVVRRALKLTVEIPADKSVAWVYRGVGDGR